jgi:hypothetical protein
VKVDASSKPGLARSTEQIAVLLNSPKFGELMLMLLAVQAQLLLQQEHFAAPVQGLLGSSSTTAASTAAAAAAATPAVPHHLQLWQDPRLPCALLDQAAAAARKLTRVDGSTQASFLAAVNAVDAPFAALAKLTGPKRQPATAADLSAQQLQLAVMGMRVPLLLLDVAQRAANRLISSSSSSGSNTIHAARTLFMMCLQQCRGADELLATAWYNRQQQPHSKQ